jgi:hypothetical protein
MEAAFLLSIEARKLRRAALTESGAAEDEVIDSLRARNR